MFQGFIQGKDYGQFGLQRLGNSRLSRATCEINRRASREVNARDGLLFRGSLMKRPPTGSDSYCRRAASSSLVLSQRGSESLPAVPATTHTRSTKRSSPTKGEKVTLHSSSWMSHISISANLTHPSRQTQPLTRCDRTRTAAAAAGRSGKHQKK